MNRFQKAYDSWDGKVPKTSVEPELKAWLLAECAEKYNLKIFVETGTAKGDTTIRVAPLFDRVYTFEIMKSYFEAASNFFMEMNGKNHIDHIVAFNESSASKTFADLVESLDEPALFYLDAHYCGEGTGRDASLDTPEVPVLHELKTIMKSPLDHVVVIDDARLFRGQEFYTTEEGQYPSIDQLSAVLREPYTIERVIDAFVVKP